MESGAEDEPKSDRCLRRSAVRRWRAEASTQPKAGESFASRPHARRQAGRDALEAELDLGARQHEGQSEADRARAAAEGVDPGGQIMIHGWPNEPKYDLRRYQATDWTDGCIAVSNADMVDIWLMTRESTPIESRP